MNNVPSLDRVPVSVIAPLIKKWLEVYSVDRSHSEGVTADHEGYLGVLAFHSGVSARTLRRITTNTVLAGSHRHGTQGHSDHISFDMADKIVCATLGPLAWHTEESLMPFYGPVEVTVTELRQGYELPEGYEFNDLSRPKQLLWIKARREEIAA